MHGLLFIGLLLLKMKVFYKIEWRYEANPKTIFGFGIENPLAELLIRNDKWQVRGSLATLCYVGNCKALFQIKVLLQILIHYEAQKYTASFLA